MDQSRIFILINSLIKKYYLNNYCNCLNNISLLSDNYYKNYFVNSLIIYSKFFKSLVSNICINTYKYSSKLLLIFSKEYSINLIKYIFVFNVKTLLSMHAFILYLFFYKNISK